MMERRTSALRGRREQMDVVGHQHLRVHLARFPAGYFAQILQVADALGFGEEAGLPVVAALNQMLRGAGHVESWKSGHGAIPGVELCR